jgi:C4-dicarboxylate transporter DctM subunit
MVQAAYSSIDLFPLLAIPLFIFAGDLLMKGGFTRVLANFAGQVVGNVTGGLGAVTIGGTTFFAAMSGSGPADAAAIGSVMIPTMVENGYEKSYAGALCACSGGLAVLVPPSIPLILWGITAEVSIAKLFLAGIIPGLLTAAALFIVNYLVSRKRNYRQSGIQQRSFNTIFKTGWEAKWVFLAPILILGGIYGGIFTITEASVIAVLYALFCGTFLYKELTWQDILDSIINTARLTGTIALVLFTARVFGHLLILYRIPQAFASWLLTITANPFLLLSIILLLLLFVGMWMETAAQIFILTPILLPVVKQVGIDPLAFGILFVMACQIGFETPPFGINLYVVTKIADSSIEAISRNAIFFAIAETSAMFLVAALPILAVWLPNVLLN